MSDWFIVATCITVAHGLCKCIDGIGLTLFHSCSSGVLLDLLSPQPSTGLDGLASTVLVSKADAPGVGTACHRTPTKLAQAGAEADGDWQVL